MIKFKCPACDQDIEAPDNILLEDHVDCPNCSHAFNPENVQRLEPLPPRPATIPAGNGSASHKIHAPPKSELNKLETAEFKFVCRMAGRFSGAACISAILGCAGIFFALIAFAYDAQLSAASGAETNSQEVSPFSCFVFAGALFSMALWFYLIAQLLHIRSILLKKS